MVMMRDGDIDDYHDDGGGDVSGGGAQDVCDSNGHDGGTLKHHPNT